MKDKKIPDCLFFDEKPFSDIDIDSPQGLIAGQIVELITTCGCLKNRSIFLNGAWGSGKTSIIEYLKKEKKDKMDVLTIDAWDAPKTLVAWDILKRIADEVLGIKYQRERLENEEFQKWFSGSYRKNLKNAKWTGLVYFTIFAFAPFTAFFITLYSGKAPQSDSLIMFLIQPATIIGFISIFIVAVLIFTAYNKLSEILLPFFLGSASQYSEYSEGEDCPPSKAEEIACYILEYYKKPHLAVFIDNLDRLEPSAQRNYLDSLFIVMDAFFEQKICQEQDNQCKTWFIIAADESKMLDSSSAKLSSPEDSAKLSSPEDSAKSSSVLWQNYADKIAPLQLFLPNPTEEALGLVFRRLWDEKTDLKEREPSIIDYTLSLGTYDTYRDVKKTLNSISLLYSMFKKITAEKEEGAAEKKEGTVEKLDKNMLFLAVCFASIKNREPNFKFDRGEISKALGNLPGFVSDRDLLIEYIYSAYYLVPLLNQEYVFKLINNALGNSKALVPLFSLAKVFPEKILDFFIRYLSEACGTPGDICDFYLKIVYPINNEGGKP